MDKSSDYESLVKMLAKANIKHSVEMNENELCIVVKDDEGCVFFTFNVNGGLVSVEGGEINW